MKTVTEKWFGEEFRNLHPSLQRLHRQGGVLAGEVEVAYGKGLASMIGKRLGRKLGLPTQNCCVPLRVEISHTDTEMIWARQFGSAEKAMVSAFSPAGHYPGGNWTESTGGIVLQLGVELQEGEWHWIQRASAVKGVAIPAFLLPELKAKKVVTDDGYHFSVSLSKRGIGLLVQYQGTLEEVV